MPLLYWLDAQPFKPSCGASSVVRALCANRAVLRSKVVGRAGRGRDYQWRSCDGRAQPRVVWAMPRSVERAQASDGADDRQKRETPFRFRPLLGQVGLQRAVEHTLSKISSIDHPLRVSAED